MSTIQLNPEQQAVLDGNGVVRAVDPRTNAAYVLIPEADFRRMQAMTESGTLLMTAEMIDRIMADDDANDPMLDYYQRNYLP